MSYISYFCYIFIYLLICHYKSYSNIKVLKQNVRKNKIYITSSEFYKLFSSLGDLYMYILYVLTVGLFVSRSSLSLNRMEYFEEKNLNISYRTIEQFFRNVDKCQI